MNLTSLSDIGKGISDLELSLSSFEKMVSESLQFEKLFSEHMKSMGWEEIQSNKFFKITRLDKKGVV